MFSLVLGFKVRGIEPETTIIHFLAAEASLRVKYAYQKIETLHM